MSAIRSVGPTFSPRDAVQLAQSLYGLTELVRELPSERDQNFLFRGDGGREFTLKIANRDEVRSVLELQNKAIACVGQGLSILHTLDGQTIATAQAEDGAVHFVRLVTFIPGIPLAEFRPHSSRLLADLGRLLGRADKALASIDRSEGARELYWDIRNAARVIDGYKYLIKDRAKRSIVERILKEWQESVVPHLSSLRTSVIHNDANDYNLIVDDAGSVGLIDFGDMLETYTVCEPAIACAYAMLDKPDPLAAAADVIGGYHETYPLTEVELGFIYHFIRTRLAMSVTIAAHQKQLEPENEYLLISEKPAWTLLEKLDTLHPRFAHYTFREACHLPACPANAAIVRFLREEGPEFHSVVDVNLAGCDAVVLDLGIGSMEVGTRDEMAVTGRFTKTLFRRIEDAGAHVGVGRYNEPRCVYTSELFRSESNDGPEWRTIHLGIDLFMEAGAIITAPLDGTVYSVRNNPAPLDYGPTIILRHATPDDVEFFTLYGHLSMDSLDGLCAGDAVRAGDRIAKIGTAPTNGGWPPHLHFQIVADMLDRDGEFPGVAAPSKREVWLSLSPDPNLILGIPAEKFPKEPSSRDETLAARRQVIGPNLSISYQTPLKIVRGSGAYLFDDVGRGYLDCVNNVAHVGHCHPRVVRAAQRQLAVLNTNTRYLHDNIVEYARRLTAKLPPSLSVCFFVNSGSEANDLALRLARVHTRAKDVIVMETAYHGNLTSLIDISPYKFDGPGGSGASPHVHKVSMADGYRGRYKWGDPAIASKYAAEADDAIAAMSRRGLRPAAFIMESLLSCAGQVVLPPGYLAQAYRHVRAAGGVCIADEVQVGFGRVGTHFWGFETQDVIPDIVTMGKSIGGGHPLAAVVTTPEIAASFNNGMEYFNTFGGNPVSCAVGLAVLEVIEEAKLQENARSTGDELKADLTGLRSRFPLIGDVRGLGLFVGMELVLDPATLEPAPIQTSYIVERMRSRGILLSTDGPFHNVIKIKPPMVFSSRDVELLMSSLHVVLGERGAGA
jgi:4-aminobutyrate aminotransferase-like enzyme/Ser/Thr protein kinase RdoA (MazF antagonist)